MRLSAFLVLAALLAAPALAAEDTVYKEHDKTATIDVPGGRFMMLGEDCTLTVKGDFDEIVIPGDDNVITLTGRVARINLSGEDNTIRWTQETPPEVIDKGKGNKLGPAE